MYQYRNRTGMFYDPKPCITTCLFVFAEYVLSTLLFCFINIYLFLLWSFTYDTLINLLSTQLFDMRKVSFTSLCNYWNKHYYHWHLLDTYYRTSLFVLKQTKSTSQYRMVLFSNTKPLLFYSILLYLLCF